MNVNRSLSRTSIFGTHLYWFERRRGSSTLFRFLQIFVLGGVVFFFSPTVTNQFARAKREPAPSQRRDGDDWIKPIVLVRPRVPPPPPRAWSYADVSKSCSPAYPPPPKKSLLPRTPPVASARHHPSHDQGERHDASAPTDARRDDTSATASTTCRRCWCSMLSSSSSLL